MSRSARPRSAHRAATIALVAASSYAALAGDSGTLDVEIRNRAIVNGSIGAPRELDTMRIRLPEGAALQAVVRGTGRMQPTLRLLDESGNEIALGAAIRRKGRTTTLKPFTPGAAGLYRIDLRDAGAATGRYTLQASWKLPAAEPFAGTVPEGGAFYAFDAEAGTRLDVRLRAFGTGATVRAVRVSGPRGYERLFPEPRKPAATHRVMTPPLPTTGRYRVDLVTDVADREVSGSIVRRAATKASRLDLRAAERRGKGIARTVSRIIDQDGGGVEVPMLEEAQRVSIDTSGVAVILPVNAVSLPSVIQVRSDDDAIDDPLGFNPAGASVQFAAPQTTFGEELSITLPYDVGAFATGDVLTEICVLRKADDGGVFEIPRSTATVDIGAGLVTFPTASFSSYQVFSPPVELVIEAEYGFPNDLASAPDEEALYMSTDFLTDELPAAAVFRRTSDGTIDLYAGGGVLTGDFIDRLEYDFDSDAGFSGVFISALAAGPDGLLVIVTGDPDRTRSVAYAVRADGLVVRIAGDGTADLDESLPSRDTGLPFCCAAAFRPGGQVVLVTDSLVYPESDRVLMVYSTGETLESLRIGTVAGGGTSDFEGSAPLETRLLQPRAVVVDSQDRILVGDRDWLVRFDEAAGTTTTIGGTNFGETSSPNGRTIGGVGAPLRTVVLGAIDDLAFAPGREDLLYVADPEAGIVWRFDLERDRAFIAAGRRVEFGRTLTTREPDPDRFDPNEPLNYPVAVAPVGSEVFIAERFKNRLFTLRRRAQ